MLIDFNYIKDKYFMNICGVVHVGAHFGEEIPMYLDHGINKIVCFEPVKENLNVLNKYSDLIKIIPVALGHKKYKTEIFISSNDAESSSILRPKKHLSQHPGITFDSVEKIQVDTLSSYKEEIRGCNFLNIDVQGFEYQVFVGAGDLIKQFDYIYSEVNKDETYENNVMIDEIDNYLKDFGFQRVETDWSGTIWGDAFYIRKENGDII